MWRTWRGIAIAVVITPPSPRDDVGHPQRRRHAAAPERERGRIAVRVRPPRRARCEHDLATFALGEHLRVGTMARELGALRLGRCRNDERADTAGREIRRD